jgi:hypothetical protein
MVLKTEFEKKTLEKADSKNLLTPEKIVVDQFILLKTVSKPDEPFANINIAPYGEDCKFFNLQHSFKKELENIFYVSFTCEYYDMTKLVTLKIEKGKPLLPSVHNIAGNNLLNVKVASDPEAINYAFHMGNIIVMVNF